MNHKQADSDIALFERICEEIHIFLDLSDKKIAAEVEARYDIPKEKVMEQFNRTDSSDYSTAQLIMMAYDPRFFG